jgi:hypothetical protein
LQKAGAPDEASVDGHSAATFYQQRTLSTDTAISLARAHSCIVLAAGSGNGDGSTITDDSSAAKAFAQKATQPMLGFLKDNGFTNAPSVLLAGAVELSPDHSAWRFTPEVLYLGTPLTTNSWIRGNGRDLVVTLTVSGPGATASDASIATRSIMIGRSFTSRPDTAYDKSLLAGLATGWMPLPKPSDDVQERITAGNKRRDDRATMEKTLDDLQKQLASAAPAARGALSAKIIKAKAEIADLNALISRDLALLDQVAPVTFSFDVKETRDGNKFIAGVGKFLSDNADEIAKPASDRIASRLDPDARTDAAILAVAAQDKLRVDAITAVSAWQTSKAGGEDAYKQRVARIGAEGACMALKLKGFADPVCLELEQ